MITPRDTSRNGLLKVAAGGVLTGILTPLLPPLIDQINGSPGDFRLALVAVPFAILVLILVRRASATPWWAALAAAIVTMIAFVAAVNAAIWIDGQVGDVGKVVQKYSGRIGRRLHRCDRDGAWDMLAAVEPARCCGVVADARDRHHCRRAAGARRRARARPDLVALSGVASRRRGRAGDGVAAERYRAAITMISTLY